jgi:hypothetical protein
MDAYVLPRNGAQVAREDSEVRFTLPVKCLPELKQVSVSLGYQNVSDTKTLMSLRCSILGSIFRATATILAASSLMPVHLMPAQS